MTTTKQEGFDAWALVEIDPHERLPCDDVLAHTSGDPLVLPAPTDDEVGDAGHFGGMEGDPDEDFEDDHSDFAERP